MKMNLKNRELKYKPLSKFRIKKIKFTSKNLFAFLVSFSVVAFILGIIFYYFLNEADKSLVINNIENYFTIKENYDYFNLIKNSFMENTFNIFLIWILGISVIGVFVTVFIYFCEIFGLGFIISSIIGKYGVKGILGVIIYLFPSKIFYVIVLFLLTFFAIKISYKLIKLCFSKEEVVIKEEIRKYFKILIFSFISIVAITLLEVFIDPFLIKFFTKL